MIGFSQYNPAVAIDTVETDSGAVILYRNFTWSYLADEPVLYEPGEDSSGTFSSHWNTTQIFTYRMNRDSVKDTIIMLTDSGGIFTMPTQGKFLRGFMYTHKGLDIRANKGDTVRAAFDGVVRYSRYNRGGFGNLIILRHYNGLETYYAHLTKSNVKVNQVVKSGDVIGLIGSTGRSRGPHLHWEIRYRDVPLDPLRVINYDQGKLLSGELKITRAVFYPNDWDAKAVYHKIRSGDTLGALAKKYHTSVKEICAMNKITAKTTLRIGKTIRVR